MVQVEIQYYFHILRNRTSNILKVVKQLQVHGQIKVVIFGKLIVHQV